MDHETESECRRGLIPRADSMRRRACRGSSTGGHLFRLVTVPSGVLMISVLAGCTGIEGSSARPGVQVAVSHEAHTRVDVLFARDIIEHSAQAVGLSSQITGMKGIAAEVAAIANRIIASSTNRTNELQSLLLDWGFAPMTPGPPPAAAMPSVAVQPGEHPLFSDVDVRRLAGAAGGPQAGAVYVDLMIRQHTFTISAARDELQSGSHPGALTTARAN